MTLTLFDPTEAADLRRGWQLHALRRRMIHEFAARRDQIAAPWLSGFVTVFAAIAGSSATRTRDASPSQSQHM